MAAYTITNQYLALNATDLSNNVKKATLTLDVATNNKTAMGSTWEEFIAGLKSGSLAIEFIDDFAAAETDAVLWPLFGTVVTFEVRPDAGVVSATNPKYTGSVLIAQHVVGGSLGELAMKSHTYPTTGTVSRATA